MHINIDALLDFHSSLIFLKKRYRIFIINEVQLVVVTDEFSIRLKEADE